MSKKTLRRELLRQRRQLQPEAVYALGQRIQRRLLQSDLFQNAETLLLYSPIHNEVDTALILQAALRRHRSVVYPRVSGEQLDLVRVSSINDFKPGAYGIREPVGDCFCALNQVNLVITPGVGFDRQGYRLGYGKGFYDRLLHAGGFEGDLVGLAYGFQVMSSLPVEAHDMPVDCVMTEKETLLFVRAASPASN